MTKPKEKEYEYVMSIQEIADELHCHHANVTAILKRAFQKLKQDPKAQQLFKEFLK